MCKQDWEGLVAFKKLTLSLHGDFSSGANKGDMKACFAATKTPDMDYSRLFRVNRKPSDRRNTRAGLDVRVRVDPLPEQVDTQHMDVNRSSQVRTVATAMVRLAGSGDTISKADFQRACPNEAAILDRGNRYVLHVLHKQKFVLYKDRGTAVYIVTDKAKRQFSS